MSIPKILEFSDYNRYPADDNPTTDAEMQDFMGNQNEILKNIASVFLWQPETNYIVNQEVRSPNMPAGYLAICTTAGFTGNTEPSWDSQTLAYNDGTVTWKLSGGKVNKSGDTISNGTFSPLEINRTENKGVALKFSNSNGTMGYLGFGSKNVLTYWDEDFNGIGNIEGVIASSNYIRYTNGLQICWGGDSSSTTPTINFPASFLAGTTPYVALTAYTGGSSGYIDCPSIKSLSNTQLSVWKNRGANGQLANYNVHYIAIGRWK